MQLNSHYRNYAIILIFCFLIASCTYESSHSNIRPIELWVSGDDALTTELADALEKAFKSSKDFIMSNEKLPGTLIVSIPTHVQFEHFGSRTKVFYTVEFSTIHNEKIGTSTGSCMDNNLSECTSKILIEAKAASINIK